MPIYVVRFREGRDIAVEGTDAQWTYPEGTHAPVITVLGQGNKRVAIIVGDAVTAVYLKDAEKETDGGPIAV